jgi:thymidylate synthase
MNSLDKQYTDLLQTILDYGVDKKDRTGTGTKSIFGYTIRHNMKDGFPLLTTKKMYMKGVITELLWFLRGDTNIKFLVDNDCHIWDGDAYKNYCTQLAKDSFLSLKNKLPLDVFINKIKTNDEFAKKWGELGPVYGKQWRDWGGKDDSYVIPATWNLDLTLQKPQELIERWRKGTDQIANLINDLKTNPDSRRLMVNAWNVGELDSMVLPPCHYGFQVYTRELSFAERVVWIKNNSSTQQITLPQYIDDKFSLDEFFKPYGVPTRAISLMWNQRSVDTFLGLPFNIASYGLLLEIIAKTVNMVPDQLIGNLGDTHLYSNHIEQAKEQIGRELRVDERVCMCYENPKLDLSKIQEGMSDEEFTKVCDEFNIPTRTRTPFELPTLNINTEFWPYEGGECGVGPIDAMSVIKSFSDDNFCRCLLEEDIQLGNYQSHPTIKAPLSN